MSRAIVSKSYRSCDDPRRGLSISISALLVMIILSHRADAAAPVTAQDRWTTGSAATFIKCVDDKDEGMYGGAKIFGDELREESVVYCAWRRVWVVTKTFRNNAPKRGEGSCKSVDESRQDISVVVQALVIPLAEKGPSKVKLPVVVGDGANRTTNDVFPIPGKP